ncbi:hypothetical protein BDV96DRAFT_640692 [Lophiotrema nucula]|uniref:G-protein alpha subunit-domain-containing protein n=1 Tax=Lophiotrema nucula TaxID=690887 RepID=A0A6A5ZR02_9PLEO|nr:hypothetical protein BDV96DRAFT_640692 [Lophiotrema nucula]
MADPITIIGAVGAIANIIDVVTKSVKTINDIRQQWLEAELTLLSLASQLSALRAALDKIQEWMSTDLVEAHHQLVMDLDVSMSCCKVLVHKIDDFLSELGNTVDEPLDFRSTFKLVFGSGNIDSVQKLLERQTSALTLLLTACNCKTLSEQRVILEKSTTRRALGRAKTESASLLVLRDTNSISSKWTDTMSKLSVVFVFDQELFKTKVYSRVLRGSFKEVLRRQREPTVGGLTQREARLRSIAIDNQIKRDKMRLSQDVECLLLGSDEVGKHELMTVLRSKSQQLGSIRHPVSSRVRFRCGECHTNLLHPLGDRADFQTSISSFNKTLMILFVFDLLNYDRKVSANSSRTELMEDLVKFQRVMDSSELRHCTAILIFNNQDAFADRLKASPLEDQIPDYADGPDVGKATTYITRLFIERCSGIVPSLYRVSGGLRSPTIYEDLQSMIEKSRFSAYRRLDWMRSDAGHESTSRRTVDEDEDEDASQAPQ